MTSQCWAFYSHNMDKHGPNDQNCPFWAICDHSFYINVNATDLDDQL